MKYAPKIYARAFAEIAAEKMSANEEKKIIGNFLSLIKKNGDWRSLEKIIGESEKNLAVKNGLKRILIETARELPRETEKLTSQIAGKNDLVERKINPELIAGARITVNDTEELDMSLARKLQKMFRR